MSLLGNGIEYLEIDEYNDSEGGGVDHRISRLGSGGETAHTMEAEKRIRREIANSNERRRMQSINAGFQSLRTLLPRHEGEKLSKAAILQQTAEYIYALEQEKTRLLSQNCQLKRLVDLHEGGDIPIKKRKTDNVLADCPVITDVPEDVETIKPEPVAIISVVDNTPTSSAEMAELRVQLERERRLRIVLEKQVRNMESQMFPESLRDMSHQITVEYEGVETLDSGTPRDIEYEEETTIAAEEVTGTTVVVCQSSQPDEMLEPIEQEHGLELDDVEDDSIVVKAEPKVEVEMVGSEEEPSRLYLASTSRQNLETIVEAIRHLEGDHLFAEEQQELPLALTNKPDQRLLRVEMNDFLHFHPQTRPGVIVVKHS